MSERIPKHDLYKHAKRYLKAVHELTDGVPNSDYATTLKEVREKLDLPSDTITQVENFLGGGLEQEGIAFVHWGPTFGKVSLTDTGADDCDEDFALLRETLRIPDVEETPPWLEEILSLANDKIGAVWRDERIKTGKKLNNLREQLGKLGTYPGSATPQGTREILEVEMRNYADGIMSAVATLLDATNEPLMLANEKQIEKFCLDKFSDANNVDGPMKVFGNEVGQAYRGKPSSTSDQIRNKLLAAKGTAHHDLKIALKEYFYKRRQSTQPATSPDRSELEKSPDTPIEEMQSTRPELVHATSPILRFVTVGVLLITLFLILVGLWLVYSDATAETTLRFFGQEFSSDSIGFGVIFLGGVILVLLIRRVLSSLDRVVDSETRDP